MINSEKNPRVYSVERLIFQVLFQEGTKKVIGVEYSRHGKTKVAYANKEVVISAGKRLNFPIQN